MLKVLGILVGGIFIGAIGMEIVNSTRPEAMNRVYTKIRNLSKAAKEAFMKGYYSGLALEKYQAEGI